MCPGGGDSDHLGAVGQPQGIVFIEKQVCYGLGIRQTHVIVAAIAGQIGERLGHEGRPQALLLRYRPHHPAEEGMAVGARHGVGVRPVNLELPTLEMIASHTLEFFPRLQHAHATPVDRHLRHYAGLQSHNQRRSGPERLLSGRQVGHLRVQGRARCRKASRTLIATGQTPELIRPFAYQRFFENRLVGEKAEAAVSS